MPFRRRWPTNSANCLTCPWADGLSRLARQAAFAGDILPGADYVLVDDFVGQGGTLANLRCLIESRGGRVIAATTLTGKPHRHYWRRRSPN